MLSYPAYGIELGDGAVKAVKLVRRGTRLVVTWADYRPYARAEDGAVRPVAGLPPRSEATLREFLAAASPGALDRTYVGFPSVATFNQLLHVPDVGAERLQSITDYETHRSLRGSVSDYEVRSRILKRHGQQEEIPCILFAVRRNLRDAFVAGLRETGLEVDNLLPSPAALALFARYDRPAKGDRIVVSVGLRGTEVVFLRDQGYAFRTLPLGMVGLLDIKESDTARRTDAARRLVERIAAEIDSGVRFFFGDARRFDPSALLLFGEGASVPEIVAQFERVSKAPVEAIETLHRIGIDPRIDKPMARRIPQMGQALGLAIAAARAERPEIELLPRNRGREAGRRLPGLALAAAGVSVAAFLFSRHDVAEARDLATVEVQPAADEIEARRQAFGETSARLDQIARESDQLDRFAVGRSHRAALLSSVLQLLGPDNVDYGESDLRVGDLRIDRDGDVTRLSGRVRAAHDDARAATVLRQRLAATGTLRDISVTEAARDEFAERILYAFSAVIPSPDAPAEGSR